MFSIGPSSKRILHDTGSEMEEERVLTICPLFTFYEDTSQATSGAFRSADPMFPCSENCFGHPILISIAETSFSLQILLLPSSYTTFAASTAIVPVGTPN